MADRFASSVMSTRRRFLAFIEAIFTAGGGRADSYRVETSNGAGMFGISNFPRERREEVDETFRNEFSRNFLFHSTLNRNVRIFWLNERRPL